MIVAREAGETKIAGAGRAAVFAGDDVVDLKGKFVVLLRELAVFAAAARSPPYQCYQFSIHAR